MAVSQQSAGRFPYLERSNWLIFLIRANLAALQERKNYMDKNIAGLLGAVAGLTTMSTVQAIEAI